MANEARWTAPSVQTILADNTALASRADGFFNIAQVSAADVVIDNSTALHLFIDIELELGAAAWPVGGWFDLWLIEALDGVNYDSGSATVLPGAAPDAVLLTHGNSAALTSQAIQLSVPRIVIPPARFKLLWRNRSGAATAATGNALRYRSYSMNLNG